MADNKTSFFKIRLAGDANTTRAKKLKLESYLGLSKGSMFSTESFETADEVKKYLRKLNIRVVSVSKLIR